ncbi:MAG: hypothetical protein ACM31C_07895, partial [Acidobacteriota bacterium]
SDAVESEGNVMMAVTDGADAAGLVGPLTADQVAARIAANVALRWQPSGCATVTSSGANVTIKFDDCTGPRGLLHVTGELDLVVSISAAGAIDVAGTASGLQVNRAVLDVDTHAEYTVSGTMHQLAVQTTGTGTGPFGNTIDHSGNYTVAWDPASTCGSIDGMWSTEISNTTASATRSNELNVMRCAGGCPTGTLVHTGFAGVTLTVTFDGSATASWTTSTGKSGTFALQCQ